MRLEEARKSLLGVDPPPDKQKKKPLQPPGGKKLQKSSVKPAQSVVITRSNNPKTKEVVKKAEKDKQEQKLPEYLNLLIQAIWLPFLLVQQIYKFGVYVGNLPGRIWTSTLYILSLPSIWLDSLCKFVVGLVTSPLCLWDWLIGQFEWLGQLFVRYHIGGLLVLLSAAYLFPATMTYPLFAIFRLVLGTLYPAYASYKAVRTKNVREYVKWMMYWIVFALFSGVETFADIFVAFWFPFYYEVKILFLLWLISPVSKGSLGSSILYRRFVHPALMRREDEIDHMILRLQDQGYNTVTRLGARAFTYVSNMVMQTAIKAPAIMADIVQHQREQERLQGNRDMTDDTSVGRFVEVGEGASNDAVMPMDEDLRESKSLFAQQDLDMETEREIESPISNEVDDHKKKPVRKSQRKRVGKAKSGSEFSSDSDAMDHRDMDPDFDPEVTMAIMGPPQAPETRKRGGKKKTAKKQ